MNKAEMLKPELHLEFLLRQTGCDHAEHQINEENFPLPDNFFLGFNPEIHLSSGDFYSEQAIAMMKGESRIPGSHLDLLDYILNNPSDDLDSPIVALGRPGHFYGEKYIVCAGSNYRKPSFTVRPFKSLWPKRFRVISVLGSA